VERPRDGLTPTPLWLLNVLVTGVGAVVGRGGDEAKLFRVEVGQWHAMRLEATRMGGHVVVAAHGRRWRWKTKHQETVVMACLKERDGPEWAKAQLGRHGRVGRGERVVDHGREGWIVAKLWGRFGPYRHSRLIAW
jgi:hypothetical protein